MMTSAQNLGKTLKEQREQLGLTLQEVAEHTRIRKIHLESIEKGQLQNLPGQVYVTGFIRVYARHLGLDSDALLSQLETSLNPESSQSADPEARGNGREQSATSPKSDRGWGAFILGFAAVLVLGSLFYFMPGFFDPPDPISQDVPSSRQAPSAQQGEAGSATKAVDEDQTDAENQADPVDEQPTANDLLPAVATNGSTLSMLALAESSLIIYIDDHEPREYPLHNGLELTWDVKNAVRVELAAPGVARFRLDDQELNLVELKAFQLSTDPGE